jgi:hypothetical protein
VTDWDRGTEGEKRRRYPSFQRIVRATRCGERRLSRVFPRKADPLGAEHPPHRGSEARLAASNTISAARSAGALEPISMI